MSHVVIFSMAATDHRGCLHLQAVVWRQGQGWARVGQAGAADEPRAVQSGYRKRDASSQQDGVAQGRLNKRGRGPQQVQLLCQVHGSAFLAWCDNPRQGVTAGELQPQVLALADYRQQSPTKQGC